VQAVKAADHGLGERRSVFQKLTRIIFVLAVSGRAAARRSRRGLLGKANKYSHEVAFGATFINVSGAIPGSMWIESAMTIDGISTSAMMGRKKLTLGDATFFTEFIKNLSTVASCFPHVAPLHRLCPRPPDHLSLPHSDFSICLSQSRSGFTAP
jgi:hypothetical protein